MDNDPADKGSLVHATFVLPVKSSAVKDANGL